MYGVKVTDRFSCERDETETRNRLYNFGGKEKKLRWNRRVSRKNGNN